MSDQAVAIPKVKHDWYQTESQVIITILLKNASSDKVSIQYGKNSLSVSSLLAPDSDIEYNLELKLAHEVDPTMCTYIVSPSKIEVKLKKVEENLQWTNLEGDGKQDNIKAIPQAVGEASGLPASLKYPSPFTKDWDKIERDIEKEIQEDKDKEMPRGATALNQLFQKIYGQGSDEVKRAMNKSFMESGGTVLSTNWNKVQKEKVKPKPVECISYKDWD